jgi:hypothetical protein
MDRARRGEGTDEPGTGARIVAAVARAGCLLRGRRAEPLGPEAPLVNARDALVPGAVDARQETLVAEIVGQEHAGDLRQALGDRQHQISPGPRRVAGQKTGLVPRNNRLQGRSHRVEEPPQL